MFVANNQPVVWRGPMLHRALQQFLADVYWGDLDVLLMDLPPGTGDIAISVAQLVPPAELLVVTTPQQAAAEVAERAGTIALQTHQQIAGVIENMSWLPCPHCDEPDRGVRQRRRPGGRRRAEPRRSAPRCRCSARSRSTPGCARAATPAARWCSTDPDAPAALALDARSPTRSAAGPAAWPAARWGSAPPAADPLAAGSGRVLVVRRGARPSAVRRPARSRGVAAAGPVARRSSRSSRSSGSSRCLRTRSRGFRSAQSRCPRAPGRARGSPRPRASLAIRAQLAQHPRRVGGVAGQLLRARARAARSPPAR